MLTYEDALERVLKATPRPRTARVNLREALGLVLARRVVAPIDLPRFDNAAVDGYALRLPTPRLRQAGLPDGAAEPLALTVVGRAEAGRPFGKRLKDGQAIRILTGAQVPRGANAVVMQEQARVIGNRLLVDRAPARGQHIRRRGEDLARDARALPAGALLRPQELGLLAALGHRAMRVYRRPTVAILATGDELQAPGTRLKPGQIYESNGELVRALVQQAGAETQALGVVSDDVARLCAIIRRGLDADVLVITGGVSVGDKDYVREAVLRCGVRQMFWKVDMKPGMPLFFGRRGRTLVFGLPGNQVSVYVCFNEFVAPALARLSGRSWEDPYGEPAVLVEDLQMSTSRRTHFVRVRCSRHHQLVAEPLNGQGSHHLRSLTETDGWVRLRSDLGPWRAGAPVLVKPEPSR